MQFDELIEHAKFHKNKHGDDFVTFLSKHYGKKKIEHSEDQRGEQKEHEKLPFHYQGYINAFIALVTLQPEIGYKGLDFSKETETIFYYQPSSSSLHKKALLQPPIKA